jgi:hypothetical protein
MMRIFDELKEAEWLIKNGFRKGFNTFEIGLVAKYYRYINLKEKEVKENTFEFCKKYYPVYNEILDYPIIERQIRKSKKYKLRIPVDVPITENELNIIKSLHNYRHEKILFTMLFLAKYEKLTNISNKTEVNKNYYSNQKLSTIYKLSHTSKKKNENIRNILYKKELIIDVDVNIFLLKFVDYQDTSEIKIVINNVDDIISFYPPYCEICGKILEKKSNSHKLCNNCFENKRQLKKNEWRRNYYQKTKL